MCADAASPCTTDEDGDCTVVSYEDSSLLACKNRRMGRLHAWPSERSEHAACSGPHASRALHPSSCSCAPPHTLLIFSTLGTPSSNPCCNCMRPCTHMHGGCKHPLLAGKHTQAHVVTVLAACTCMHVTQVFFAQAPRGITENDIRALFSSFGRVKAVKCFRYAHSPRIRPASRAAAILPGDARRVSFGDTKGSGLVKMASAREAAAAIRGLDGIFKFTSDTEPLVRLHAPWSCMRAGCVRPSHESVATRLVNACISMHDRACMHTCVDQQAAANNLCCKLHACTHQQHWTLPPFPQAFNPCTCCIVPDASSGSLTNMSPTHPLLNVIRWCA